jgi:hypothetical protein
VARRFYLSFPDDCYLFLAPQSLKVYPRAGQTSTTAPHPVSPLR